MKNKKQKTKTDNYNNCNFLKLFVDKVKYITYNVSHNLVKKRKNKNDEKRIYDQS